MALRSFADGAVFAEVFGASKPRVLALHGWGRRGADFKKSLDGIPALAPDFPGFGSSPPPEQVTGAAGFAEMILPLLDEFDSPPLVVGHSFGGRVAVCLAAEYPGRVGPLLLTGVPLVRAHPARKPRLSFRLMRSLNRIGLVSDARMEQLRQSSGSADYRAAEGVMREVLVVVINESYEEQLKVIESPTVLLWGSEDTEVPVSVARAAADIMRQAGRAEPHLSVVDGVGHHLPIEAPETLREAMNSLLG